MIRLKKIIILNLIMVLMITLLSCGKNKENTSLQANNKLKKFKVTKTYKEAELDSKNLNVKEFKVKSVEKSSNKLIVIAKSELDNDVDAYNTSIFLKNTIENLNKEKIESEKIKSVEIEIIGKKNWYFDTKDSIKKITFIK